MADDPKAMAQLPPEKWRRSYPLYSDSERGLYFAPEERANFARMQLFSEDFTCHWVDVWLELKGHTLEVYQDEASKDCTLLFDLKECFPLGAAKGLPGSTVDKDCGRFAIFSRYYLDKALARNVFVFEVSSPADAKGWLQGLNLNHEWALRFSALYHPMGTAAVYTDEQDGKWRVQKRFMNVPMVPHDTLHGTALLDADIDKLGGSRLEGRFQKRRLSVRDAGKRLEYADEGEVKGDVSMERAHVVLVVNDVLTKSKAKKTPKLVEAMEHVNWFGVVTDADDRVFVFRAADSDSCERWCVSLASLAVADAQNLTVLINAKVAQYEKSSQKPLAYKSHPLPDAAYVMHTRPSESSGGGGGGGGGSGALKVPEARGTRKFNKADSAPRLSPPASPRRSVQVAPVTAPGEAAGRNRRLLTESSTSTSTESLFRSTSPRAGDGSAKASIGRRAGAGMATDVSERKSPTGRHKSPAPADDDDYLEPIPVEEPAPVITKALPDRGSGRKSDSSKNPAASSERGSAKGASSERSSGKAASTAVDRSAGRAEASKKPEPEPKVEPETAFQRLRTATQSIKNKKAAREEVLAVKSGREPLERPEPPRDPQAELNARREKERVARAQERRRKLEEQRKAREAGTDADEGAAARKQAPRTTGGSASPRGRPSDQDSEKLRAEIQRLKAEVETEAAARAEAEAALSATREKMDAEKANARLLKQLARDFKAQAEESAAAVQNLTAQLEDAQAAELEAQERHERELQQARADAERGAGASRDERSEELERRIEALQAALDKAKSDSKAQAREMREQTAALESAEKAVKQLEEENHLLLEEIEESNKMQQAVEDLMDLGDPVELMEQLAELIKENEELKAELDELTGK